jgi:3-oxoacyl-[acyl-carrier protein] reductase
MDTGNPQIVCRRLVGRTVIVTGGGHGLGKAYSKRLAQEGANVVVADIDGTAAKAVAQKLEVEVGSKALGVAVDVSNVDSLRAMVAETVETFGRIDVLVNNAAIFATIPISRLPFDEISIAEWDKIMEVNLKGVWLACRAVVPEMKRNKYGKIINISSGTAFKGTAGRVHYVASKAAILGFTRTMANELGPFNITVNCVAPGSTLSEDHATDEVRTFRQSGASSRALQRMQLPEDLVGSIAFFASGDSDFITGQTLVVDGGAYMH